MNYRQLPVIEKSQPIAPTYQIKPDAQHQYGAPWKMGLQEPLPVAKIDRCEEIDQINLRKIPKSME